MAETKAHAEWMKENTVVVKARLQRSPMPISSST